MNIIEFIKYAYNVIEAYSCETVPRKYSPIYIYYDELSIDLKKDLPELILVWMLEGESLLMEFEGRKYILYNIQYCAVFSSIYSSIENGEISKDMIDNILQHLYPGCHHLSPITDFAFDKSIASNEKYFYPLLKLYPDCFSSYNEIIKTYDFSILMLMFILGHEISHYLLHNHDVDFDIPFEYEDDKIQFDEIDEALNKIYDNKLPYSSIFKEKTLQEEIECDRIAVIITWKYLVFKKNSIDPIYLVHSLILIFKIFKLLKFIELISKSGNTKVMYELDIRDVLMQRFFSILYDSYQIVSLNDLAEDKSFEMLRHFCGAYETLIITLNDVFNRCTNRILYIVNHILDMATQMYNGAYYDENNNLKLNWNLKMNNEIYKYCDIFKSCNFLIKIADDISSKYVDKEGISSVKLKNLLFSMAKMLSLVHNNTPFKRKITGGDIENISEITMIRNNFYSMFNERIFLEIDLGSEDENLKSLYRQLIKDTIKIELTL